MAVPVPTRRAFLGWLSASVAGGGLALYSEAPATVAEAEVRTALSETAAPSSFVIRNTSQAAMVIGYRRSEIDHATPGAIRHDVAPARTSGTILLPGEELVITAREWSGR